MLNLNAPLLWPDCRPCFLSEVTKSFKQDDQRNLVGDIICFVLLTPLAGISTYLCATGRYLEAVFLSLLLMYLLILI